MASTFAFLTDTVSRSSLFRHWALVIVLSSLLSTINVGFLHVQAEPSMLISAVSIDQPPPSTSPNPLNDSIAIVPIVDGQLGGSPIVNIPLTNIPNIADMRALLRISSSNDSTSANFLLEISNPSIQRRALAESIIYGFLGVSITNLCAVTGFICIPIKRSKYFNILLGFMTALAVGALFSTAILVLIPEAMRMIDMPAEFGGQGRSYLLKLGCVLAGALFFFVVEYVLLILPRLLKWKASSSGDKSFEGTDIADASNWHESSHGSRPDPANDEVSSVEKDVVLENADSNFSDNVYISQKTPATRRSRRCCLYFNKENFSNIAPVAWMILFGDGFHNFMDGLTIGAGFTQSPTIGIALSLSILFEELPHELGDFAVLLASGFSIKSAICANFTSACSAYLGLVVGLIIGEVSSGALYVFAITAGFFFYISLSDMLPSLRNALEEAEKNNANSFRLFLIQVAGLTVGFLCVLGVTLVSDLISL